VKGMEGILGGGPGFDLQPDAAAHAVGRPSGDRRGGGRVKLSRRWPSLAMLRRRGIPKALQTERLLLQGGRLGEQRPQRA
jgi:hypothetical protein